MILISTTIICLILSGIDSSETPAVGNEASKPEEKVDISETIEHEKNTDFDHKGKPDLVPFEFPANLNGEEGEDAFNVIKKKMEDFFGKDMVDEMLKYESSDGVFDYLSHADFHSMWINGIMNTVGEKLKSKETFPLDKVRSKKECRKACRKNHRNVMNYMKKTFDSVVPTMTKEDIRFAITQDPNKCYSYILNPETKQYECKCLHEGYSIKVSPRLQELIDEKFYQNDGKSFAEKIVEFQPKGEVSSISDVVTWRRAGQLAMYYAGWGSSMVTRDDNQSQDGINGKSEENDEMAEFLEYHGLIFICLFVFCNCFSYLWLGYSLVVFVTKFYLPASE